jgi:hypothetical protein
MPGPGVAGIWRENFSKLTHAEWLQRSETRRAAHTAMQRIDSVPRSFTDIRLRAHRAASFETLTMESAR